MLHLQFDRSWTQFTSVNIAWGPSGVDQMEVPMGIEMDVFSFGSHQAQQVTFEP